MTDLTISIVNYNTAELTEACVDSIFRNTHGIDFEVIVVDNHSSDDSVRRLEGRFPGVRMRALKENIGFGNAHNLAFKSARGRYVLFLNSDTYAFPDSAARAVRFLDGRPSVGLSGFGTCLDREGVLRHGPSTLPSIRDRLLYWTDYLRRFPQSRLAQGLARSRYEFWSASKPLFVDSVDGGAILARREAFAALGGFDPRFFLYFEETDLFRRAHKAGVRMMLDPGNLLQHLCGRSGGIPDAGRFLRGSVWRKSYGTYYSRHFGACGPLLCAAYVAGARLLLRARGKPRSIRGCADFGRMTHYKPANRVRLTWPAGARAEEYLVEISDSPGFERSAGSVTIQPGLRVPTNALEGRRMYWRASPVRKGSVALEETRGGMLSPA